MCDTCGCQLHEHHRHDTKVVEVNRSLLEANQKQAESNRHHIEHMGALAINLISSPGSGKTTLLERTIDALKASCAIGVIEGDIETERDADRIRAKGVPAVQLTTGGACHLDAPMVHGGLHVLEHFAKGRPFDLIFIENVGNLVCPATFDLGEHRRVVLLSTPEGSDKPAKYPATFKSADLVLITKSDLLPHFDFSVEEAASQARLLKPELEILTLSATTGDGFATWLAYLRQLLAQRSPHVH
ncbi:MAG: hydrogenase nickel incorporation protein HypB [Desulfobulbus sp.]|jgi:hydrogenase nickel incorporation protein HypB|uniref:hydrogenase nickel incorporation protein HypB n=1 Tax=Desulfobulbus sp. TaxID=895 RepID=UPI00285102DC|nr:hydrogenase nickel incorporation protein HypB [Desulfobulbus sp.]MDR2549122.1 hydrogenase nickel incorporation protein HypB [Desulfobulbus sp.]